jgi:hypothetical protein
LVPEQEHDGEEKISASVRIWILAIQQTVICQMTCKFMISLSSLS